MLERKFQVKQQGQSMVHFLQEAAPHKGQLLKLHDKAQVLTCNGSLKGQHGQINIINKDEFVQESTPSSEEFTGFNREGVEKLRNLLETLNKSSSSYSLPKPEVLVD